MNTGEGPILILTASAGAGHGVAAQAVESAIRARCPDADVEVLDVLRVCNSFFRAVYAQGYLGLVRHAPAGMGMLYDTMDRPDLGLRETLRVGFQNMNLGTVRRFLLRREPRLIINTHFLPAEVVAQLRREKKISCPQATVTTDFETHRLWVQEPTERYYTATEQGKAYLATWGVDPARILVTGIPVRPGFEQPSNGSEIRKTHELDPQRPVVLLLCGGCGVGPTEELLRELLSMPSEPTIVVITGRNEKLRKRLERLTASSDKPVRIVGFTDRMHEWMGVADLIVSKPGGLTVAEATVCGTPLVSVNAIPGQETRNSDYLLENGAAIKVNNTRLLGFRVAQLLEDPERLATLRDAARALGRPGAAARIAADALSLLEERRN